MSAPAPSPRLGRARLLGAMGMAVYLAVGPTLVWLAFAWLVPGLREAYWFLPWWVQMPGLLVSSPFIWTAISRWIEPAWPITWADPEASYVHGAPAGAAPQLHETLVTRGGVVGHLALGLFLWLLLPASLLLGGVFMPPPG